MYLLVGLASFPLAAAPFFFLFHRVYSLKRAQKRKEKVQRISYGAAGEKMSERRRWRQTRNPSCRPSRRSDSVWGEGGGREGGGLCS